MQPPSDPLTSVKVRTSIRDRLKKRFHKTESDSINSVIRDLLDVAEKHEATAVAKKVKRKQTRKAQTARKKATRKKRKKATTRKR